MARFAAKVDANHKAVVQALRDEGGDAVSVFSLADVGRGVPDLLVGIHERTYLCEVKDGDKPVSRRSLTPDQQRFVRQWCGSPVVILLSPGHAVAWLKRLGGSDASTTDA